MFELNEDVAKLPNEEATPSTINNTFIEESTNHQNMFANAMAEKNGLTRKTNRIHANFKSLIACVDI